MSRRLEREFTADGAEVLARRIVAADPAWTRLGLAAAMGPTVPPAHSEELAALVLDAFPREPVDRLGTLARYLAEIHRSDPPPTGPLTARSLTARSLAPKLWDDLPPIPDIGALARILDLTVGELDWFADHGGWLRSRAGPLQHYRFRTIAKRSGRRLLEIPKPRLRELQRRLLRLLVSRIPPHPAVYGFLAGRGPVSFSAPHAGARTVLRLDLSDFFARVTRARARAIFATVGYPRDVAGCLADLCTTATPIAGLAGIDPAVAGHLRARHLPQGAPTSPALSNLVLRRADRRISGYTARHGLTYTRYADDLAISGEAMAPREVIGMVAAIVADEGFLLNSDKIATMRADQRQRLAGLVINDRPRASRREYDALRALLHNAVRTGAAAQNRHDRPYFRDYVYGRIAWAGTSDARRRDVLRELAARVEWNA